MSELEDGVACSHPGCLSHVSHPCEGCGRIQGMDIATMAVIDYVNWRNERSLRRILPKEFFFGPTPHHEKPQWFVKAYCLERRAYRTFALTNILALRLPSEEAVEAWFKGDRPCSKLIS